MYTSQLGVRLVVFAFRILHKIDDLDPERHCSSATTASLGAPVRYTWVEHTVQLVLGVAGGADGPALLYTGIGATGAASWLV